MTRHPIRRWLLAAGFLVVCSQVGCASAPAPASDSVALTGLNVVSVRDGSIASGRTIVVQGGTIRAIVPDGAAPPTSRRIALDGRYAVPGLIDSHVHVPIDSFGRLFGAETPLSLTEQETALGPLLANGVTGAVVMIGDASALTLRDAVGSGDILGPRLVVGSPPVSGPRPILPPPASRLAQTPDEGAAVARQLVGEGYDFIKTREDLAPAVAAAIVRAAREAGAPTIGHMPDDLQSVDDYFVVPGAGAAHLYDLLYSAPYEQAGAAGLADALKARGGFVVSTLSVHANILQKNADLASTLSAPCVRHLHPQLHQLWTGIAFEPSSDSATIMAEMERHRGVVRALVTAGVPLLAGTDAGAPTIGVGCSLADELTLLAASGLTPLESLRSATLTPSEIFARFADAGVLEPGRRADILILDSDPLADIEAVRGIAGVMVGGRWLDRATLDGLLASATYR